QSLAEPGTVLISAETYKIVQKYFFCLKKGTHHLKGISVPVTVYQTVQISEAKDFQSLELTASQKLIGRESFTHQLSSAWKKVNNSEEVAVLIKGEAGIGKT